MADEEKEKNGPPKRELEPLLQPSVVTAFLSGVVVANFNKNLLLGFTVGGIVGVYLQQTFPSQFPNVTEYWEKIKKQWKGTSSSSSSNY